MARHRPDGSEHRGIGDALVGERVREVLTVVLSFAKGRKPVLRRGGSNGG